jgi:hypothetical protein
MIVNHKININSFSNTTTNPKNATINIPIDLKYQIVDNDELIQKVFVDVECKKAINCILDYDKTKFIPFETLTPSNTDIEIVRIKFKINLLNSSGTGYISPTNLSDLGITLEDISTSSNSFINGFLYFQFYDEYRSQIRNFLTESQIYNYLDVNTAIQNGVLKSPTAIPLEYISSNSKIVNEGIFTGFYVYDDIDSYPTVNAVKTLYCSAHIFNAKTGKIIDFMTTSTPPSIDKLPEKQFMKYNLKRLKNKFIYTVDQTFSSNVSFQVTSAGPSLTTRGFKDMTIDLYEIKVL